MNEEKQKENQAENGQKEKKMRKRKKINSEKRFYLLTAIGCAVALVAIVLVAVVASVDNGGVQQGGVNETPKVEAPADPDDEVNGGNGNNNPNDEQVAIVPEGMISPLETVSTINEHGFYHNQTLNSYYEHKGMDFAAEVGASVFAVEKGVVESIYTGDVLTGTEIVILHDDGLKTVYRFVDQAENLKVGDRVEKGQVIATVAEANGSEYKDGAHLHFEVLKEGVSVDPATYLTLEEK